jgi:lactate dehydrogenase-like 2-hydroxyacid dehydrogenase
MTGYFAMTAPTGRPKIWMTRRWLEPVMARLEADYDVTIHPEGAPLTPAVMQAQMRLFDALCPAASDPVTAQTLLTPDARVRIIGNFGVGYEKIDTEAAKTAGIVVTNTPDVLTDTTAELALLLVLMVSRRAQEAQRRLHAGLWSQGQLGVVLGHSLAGKTLGLVGFGRIARATGERARAALGMNIAYFSRTRAAPEVEAELGAIYVESLEALVAMSDVLSLHTPGGAETRHIIDARILRLMKPSAYLINTARGSVVDEKAVAQALRDGVIAGAGLDVFENEPKIEPDLIALDNAVLLPHMGSATFETRVAMGMKVADNLDAFFAGREPPNRVA